jgi:hypothetical protein
MFDSWFDAFIYIFWPGGVILIAILFSQIDLFNFSKKGKGKSVQQRPVHNEPTDHKTEIDQLQLNKTLEEWQSGGHKKK